MGKEFYNINSYNAKNKTPEKIKQYKSLFNNIIP